VLLFIDECHLVWGDARGYVWGPRGQRIVLPIKNVKTRQTYYGALNLLTGWPILWKADRGCKENTVAFLSYLRQVFQGRRLLLVWDGASYHTAGLVDDYVQQLPNLISPSGERPIERIPFAAREPAQNPMEDVWLAGKREVRRQWASLTTFQDVRAVFTQTITHRQFLFHKLDWYGREHLIHLRREAGFRWE
jgi:hypothetical protein